MKAVKVDQLNVGLIAISLMLAFIMPFELFLLAYAILGPLHYLTEISWLDGKSYFIQRKEAKYILIGLAIFVSIPTILYIPALEMRDSDIIKWFIRNVAEYNTAFFLAIALSVMFVFARTLVHWIVASLAIIVGSYLVYLNESIWLWFAILLPTVIHVYFFTMFFMWYGNLKSNSKWGYAALILLLAVPFIIGFSNVGNTTYGNYVEDIQDLHAYGFTSMHYNIGALLNPNAEPNAFFGSDLFVKVQVFIAFAYTYHYLNWFSKTTVIGWHKHLTSARTLIILGIWLLSILLYWNNYLNGLMVLFFLSILHVFLEFPLNVVSVKGIAQHYGGMLKKR